ncbi:protein PHLOEM PROTEIN 2-LIKE A10-like [Iris pallida]|uniref:Protein PHLOEM PROTEIN 2-LIKE A10-like n=1 Tax=Iris pallida TaxID=29817 RepID=A0AAX6DHZ5_IRIPA|nr:protein PHLOEM PROTEIN 2-LIKE A10-like [Iris pallida]
MTEALTLIPQTLVPVAELLRRRRNWIILLAGAGVSWYGLYRLYHLPEVEGRWRKLCSLLKTLVSFAEALSSSAKTVTILSSDLNSFLRSDADEVPASLKQVSKIATSDEFAGSVSSLSEALTSGVIRGGGSADDSSSSSSGFLDKVFSPSGTGFASVVVGSFARNLAVGLMHREPDSAAVLPAWMEAVGSYDRCKDVVGNCIEKFVSTLVSVYLDKTAGINAYDDIFAGITNPKHDAKVKDFMVSVCNGAVETLVRTSHQVITGPNQEEDASFAPGSSTEATDKEESGWFDKVSSTLAIPSNRRLVLDVTGRVTFETVRSFLDFTLWSFRDGARRGVWAVGDGVTERGMEVLRYFSVKSVLVTAICLALCLRVMAGTRVLLAA